MQQMTDALRRIIRSKKHLDVLNREIKAFLATDPYRCTIKIDPQDGSYIFYPYLKESFPATWGLLVGEVAHGLCSALDNIAWSVAIKRDERTAFPIYCRKNQKFISLLEKLRDEVRTDVEAVQPYKAEDGQPFRHPLWILRRIDVIDKHRIIVPGVTRLYVATGLPKPYWFYIDGFTRLNKGSIVFKRILNPNLQKDFKPQMRGHIEFDISVAPVDPDEPSRISPKDLFTIYHFIRNDVYPRFAKFLEPENRS